MICKRMDPRAEVSPQMWELVYKKGNVVARIVRCYEALPVNTSGGGSKTPCCLSVPTGNFIQPAEPRRHTWKDLENSCCPSQRSAMAVHT